MAVDRILIFCDNPSDKHGEKHPNPIVWAYRFDESHRDGTGQGWLDDIRSKRLRQFLERANMHQVLVGDEKFDAKRFTVQNRDEWVSHLRESWLLPCEKCGYEVRIVGRKLFPALTRMRELGMCRIGLLALDGGLKSTL